MSMNSVYLRDNASVMSRSSVTVGGDPLGNTAGNGSGSQTLDPERLFERDLQAALEKSYYEM